MKKLDPRTKLLCIILITTVALLIKNILWMSGLGVLSILLALTMGANLKMFFSRIKHFIIFLISILFIQIIFVRSGTPLLNIGDFVLIYSKGFYLGITTGLRFFILLCAASIMAGENNRRVIQSLVQMKIPYSFAFLLSIALRFIPLFTEAFSDAMTSMQLRGIEVKEVPVKKRIKLYTYLLLPVTADAIIKAQDLAIAMEARGFGALQKRTSLLHLQMQVIDWVLIVLLPIFFGTVTYLYYSYGG